MWSRPETMTAPILTLGYVEVVAAIAARRKNLVFFRDIYDLLFLLVHPPDDRQADDSFTTRLPPLRA
jgi:hypothetical protein